METTVLGLITAILGLLLYRKYIKNADFVNTIERIPGPVKWPFLGCVPAFIEGRKNIADFVIREIPKRFGRYVRIWVFDKPQVLITSARGLEPILKNPIFNMKSEDYALVREAMGDGLITATDPIWSKHRKLLAPTMHVSLLQDYVPTFVKNAEILCRNLLQAQKSNKNGFDIFPFMILCSLDIIAETSMGVEMNTQSNENLKYANQINRSHHVIQERYTNMCLHFYPIYYFSKTKKEHDEIMKSGHEFCRKVIAEKRKKFQESEKNPSEIQKVEGIKKRRSLLDTMLIAEKEGILSDEEIFNEVNNFMSAGLDTVSVSSTYTLYLLGTYPQYQERVVTELDEVFGDSGRIPDMNDLNRLKYLDRCIKESLRIYPPVGVFERHINQDVQCEQYLIPAGCKVTIIPSIVHRDPEFWPDPEKFDPDRFLPENSVGRHPCSYIPFSHGHRNCIGQKFAMAEEKVLISTILRKFRIESLQPRESLKVTLSVSMRPDAGVFVKLYDRHVEKIDN